MIKFMRQYIGLRITLLFFLIVKGIQFTWAAHESSSSTRISPNTDSTKNAKIWIDVDQAIDTFIETYESQNRVTLTTVNRPLKPMNEYQSGLGVVCGTFRMDFSFRGRDNDGREKRSSVIVKVNELAGFRYVFGQKILFYEKEKFMYEKVFPLMYRSWPNEKLTPRLHLVTEKSRVDLSSQLHPMTTEKSRIFFLENLHEDGFRTKRGALLDSPEMCRQVMESLAQFHALSTVPLKEENGLYQDLVARTNTSVDVRLDPETSIVYMRKFEKYVMPSLTPRMAGQVRSTYEHLQSVLVSGFKPSQNGFDVILHGHLNRSNVFFSRGKHRREGTAGCKFVDFYHSRPGSPVIDLMNYLLTSVQFDVLVKMDKETLFRSYVNEFDKTLPEGRDRYDLSQLYRDLRTYKSHFIYKLIFVVPAYWRDAEGITEENDEGVYEQVFSSERYKMFFKYWMRYLLNV